jgi:hypothetical protein
MLHACKVQGWGEYVQVMRLQGSGQQLVVSWLVLLMLLVLWSFFIYRRSLVHI